MTYQQRIARNRLVKVIAKKLYGRHKTFRDARLADAILMHGGWRSVWPALREWLLAELTGQPNRECRR